MSENIPDVDHCPKHGRYYDMETYCPDCMKAKLSALEKDNLRLTSALRDISIGEFPGELPYTKIKSPLKLCRTRAKEALAVSGGEGKVKS